VLGVGAITKEVLRLIVASVSADIVLFRSGKNPSTTWATKTEPISR
jgi:hypothetical protein